MSQEKVKYLCAVLASAFAHAGHISKEEASKISGLSDHKFEKAYNRASEIVGKAMDHEGDKMDKFLEHFGEEIDRWTEETGGMSFP